MEIKALNKVVTDVANATAEMQPGDHLSIAFKVNGEYQIINIGFQGKVICVTHEQTDKALVISPSMGARFVN